MATVAHDSGHLVTFLALPERQWVYINQLAHELGLSAEQYVSLAIQYFERVPEPSRVAHVMANVPLPSDDIGGCDG